MTILRAEAKFALLMVVSLIAGWRPLANTVRLSLNSEEYTHILLILPVTVVLIVMDWHLVEAGAKRGSFSGLVLLAVAGGLTAITVWKPAGRPDLQLTLMIAALVAWWIGSFVLCFGTQAARAFAFPLFFLLWMIPLPTSALDWIIVELQEGSAYCARFLFALFRVPVLQDGLFLTIPGVTLEVAKECSSIRSSMFLWVTTLLLAQLLLRSVWRKLLVVAVAIPLAVAKNGLRIFIIGMLGTRVDAGYMTGNFHRHGGIVFLLVAWAVVFLLLWIMRRGEEQELVAGRP